MRAPHDVRTPTSVIRAVLLHGLDAASCCSICGHLAQCTAPTGTASCLIFVGTYNGTAVANTLLKTFTLARLLTGFRIQPQAAQPTAKPCAYRARRADRTRPDGTVLARHAASARVHRQRTPFSANAR
eukprot:5020649-Prymnesium_polylepis.1